MADNNETIAAGTDFTDAQLLDFLHVFDNIRGNAQKQYTETDAYDAEHLAYQRALLTEFTSDPRYQEYMAPIANRLNRPDLLETPPIPASTESFLEGIEIPYALEDAQANVQDIYEVLESGDVDLLFSLGYEPVSPTLAGEQVESYMISVLDVGDDQISQEVDVAGNILVAHPNTLDIATQYTSVIGLNGETANEYLDFIRTRQAEAVIELEHTDLPVIPSYIEAPVIDILADMNESAVTSIISDTPPVIIDVTSRLDDIRELTELAPIDVSPEVIAEYNDRVAEINAPPHIETSEISDSLPFIDSSTPVLDSEVIAPAEPEAPASMDYEIQQGDTLSQIVADHYGLTNWADIQRVYETVARNNGIEDPDKIYTGDNLVLFDDPTVDLYPEGTEACSDLNAAFCRAVDGTTLAANSPDAPVVRPQLRPEGLALAS